MAKGLFDDAKVPIPCENCGRKMSKTIAWLKTHKQFVCACGTTVQIDSSQFRREIGKTDRAFDKLKRTIKRFNKRK